MSLSLNPNRGNLHVQTLFLISPVAFSRAIVDFSVAVLFMVRPNLPMAIFKKIKVGGHHETYLFQGSTSGVSAMYVKKPGSSSFISYTSGTQFTADGKYEFYCVDGAGNQSQTYNITLDRTKPVGTVYGGTQSMSSGAKTGAAYVKYTATDALSGVSK